MRLIEQFEPGEQERAAGYALDALAEIEATDTLVLDGLLNLDARGFRSAEFRSSAARAVQKNANRRDDLSDEVVDLLSGWLRDKEIEEWRDANSEHPPQSERQGSILWGYRQLTVLPGGNIVPLSALASILLGRKEPSRDRYIAILDEHLSRETHSSMWKALLRALNNAGRSTPHAVSNFVRRLFSEVPAIAATPEAAIFLAHAQRWDDDLVFSIIRDWATQRPS